MEKSLVTVETSKKKYKVKSFHTWDLSPNWKPPVKEKKKQVAWNKGMKMSREYREKLSLAHITTGSTDEDKLARIGIDFKEWRKKVFERDRFTCQKCLVIGTELHPHHIKAFAKYKELRYDPANGITLCKQCHKLFHKVYGVREFTEQNLLDYLKR